MIPPTRQELRALERILEGRPPKGEEYATAVLRYYLLPRINDAYIDLIEIGIKTGELGSIIFSFLKEHPSEELKSTVQLHLGSLWNNTIDLVDYAAPDDMYDNNEVYKNSVFYLEMIRIKRNLGLLLERASKYGAEDAIRSLAYTKL